MGEILKLSDVRRNKEEGWWKHITSISNRILWLLDTEDKVKVNNYKKLSDCFDLNKPKDLKQFEYIMEYTLSYIFAKSTEKRNLALEKLKELFYFNGITIKDAEWYLWIYLVLNKSEEDNIDFLFIGKYNKQFFEIL